jgi:hypothetical protein
MSRVRTQPTESATKRNKPQSHRRRETRAEFFPAEPLLEYRQPEGGPLKWCGLFYGGESRAG